MYNESFDRENEEIDFKITKKHYPRINNDKVLEFVFDKDPNLHLRKNMIIIRGYFELDPAFVIENGFAPKLFLMMTVELNSQVISRNLNRLVHVYKSDDNLF